MGSEKTKGLADEATRQDWWLNFLWSVCCDCDSLVFCDALPFHNQTAVCQHQVS